MPGAKRGHELMGGMAAMLFLFGAAIAQAIVPNGADTFVERSDGAKVHVSGFICPQRIGSFDRDAVGESDPEAKSDFCGYTAVGGVYGTIKLTPLAGPYDPKAALASDFAVQEATGGKRIAEQTIRLQDLPIAVYARSYHTASAESLEYRILFTGAAVKNWAVETSIEYSDPRDAKMKEDFLRAVYAAAQKEIDR